MEMAGKRRAVRYGQRRILAGDTHALRQPTWELLAHDVTNDAAARGAGRRAICARYNQSKPRRPTADAGCLAKLQMKLLDSFNGRTQVRPGGVNVVVSAGTAWADLRPVADDRRATTLCDADAKEELKRRVGC